MFKETLAIYERKEDAVNPNMATAFENLISMYQDQGKVAEAEGACKRYLAFRIKGLGPEHPKVAVCLNKLADIYFSQGKFDMAEPLYRQSVDLQTKGNQDNADLAETLHQYSLVLRKLGKKAPALSVEGRAAALKGKHKPKR